MNEFHLAYSKEIDKEYTSDSGSDIDRLHYPLEIIGFYLVRLDDLNVCTGFFPYVQEKTSRASLSTRAAMLTIIKCAIGAGSFSLPRAFMDGGVYISFLTTFL